MNNICNRIKEVVFENLPKIMKLRNTGKKKPDGSIVSEGDILCEKIIAKLISDEFPDVTLIAEERHHDIQSISGASAVVTVDPIDGTENFVSGLKEWGVGVCVYDNNLHHQHSMIILPELNEILESGNLPKRNTGSRILGLPSYMNTDLFKNIPNGYEYRIMGCCMYNMYNVITGAFARFEHLTGCYSWDILPGINLALEQGLKVEIEGNEYKGEFLKPGIKYHVKVYAKEN